jgi:hypothetical protein
MIKIIKPGELASNYPISALIYGQPGVGKTTLALSAPSPILIDADLGMQRVEKKFQTAVVRVLSYADIFETILCPEIKDYQTIVFDTIGKVISHIMDHIAEVNPRVKQADGSMNIRAWGLLKDEFHRLMKTTRKLGKDVIFLAHEKEEKINDIRIVRPDIMGAPGKELLQDMDMIGYMQINNKKRTISFNPDDSYYAKNSLKLRPIIEIPNIDHENTFFSKHIVAEIERQRLAEKEILFKYDLLKEKHSNLINKISSIDELNNVYQILKKEEVIWESEKAWKILLHGKSRELECAYNKENDAFEKNYKLVLEHETNEGDQ